MRRCPGGRDRTAFIRTKSPVLCLLSYARSWCVMLVRKPGTCWLEPSLRRSSPESGEALAAAVGGGDEGAGLFGEASVGVRLDAAGVRQASGDTEEVEGGRVVLLVRSGGYRAGDASAVVAEQHPDAAGAVLPGRHDDGGGERMLLLVCGSAPVAAVRVHGSSPVQLIAGAVLASAHSFLTASVVCSRVCSRSTAAVVGVRASYFSMASMSLGWLMKASNISSRSIALSEAQPVDAGHGFMLSCFVCRL